MRSFLVKTEASKLCAMQDFLFFKAGRTYLKIRFLDILYIQAEKRHVVIVTSDNRYFSTASISEIEKQLPLTVFCRIHRSYIISFHHTDKFDNELAYVGSKKIPIGEQYKSVLKKAIIIINGAIQAYMLNSDDINKLINDLSQ
jgi:DNA-binding LytR/AlgR family response regulator